MKIKYDKATAQTAKCCAIIFSVLLLIGLVMSALKIPGTEVLYIMAVYSGALICVPCWGVYLFARLYFVRLRAYGYEIPEHKKKYGDKLSELVRIQDAETSLFAKHSKIGACIYIAIFCVFMVIDTVYLFKWNFMKETCYFWYVICVVLNLLWIVLAGIMRKQENKDKYRDDVEPDDGRKERWNLENIIIFAICFMAVCAIAINLAVSTTKYVFEAQIDGDMLQADSIRRDVLSVMKEYERDGKQASSASYRAICNGVVLTEWKTPEDELQCSLAEKLQIADFGELANDFKMADGQARIYVQYRDGNAIVELLNPIGEVEKNSRVYRRIYVESDYYSHGR
ncbi:MAG: hypothetical protein UEY44_07010 [Coprococcus sp.]|nr:hypothetical protein [Coprococcus sp.]